MRASLGASQLAEALADYEQQRNAAVMPIYGLTLNSPIWQHRLLPQGNSSSPPCVETKRRPTASLVPSPGLYRFQSFSRRRTCSGSLVQDECVIPLREMALCTLLLLIEEVP